MASSADSPQAVRIATLNTWGMRGNWTGRRRVLSDGLLALDADLLTLQETIVDNGYDQAADVLGNRYEIIHQQDRESDGQGITTASRWPVGDIIELDINVTSRTGDFACASLITEILAPPPLERIWLVNNLPDWQPDHEHERELQAVRTATAVEDLLARKPGHVIVAGDFDADPAAASIRFCWTGRQSLNGHSVCYRDAWETARPGQPGHTFVPGNPNSADWDWPYRRIDYILIRCAQHGGPTLAVSSCQRTFDHPASAISDHYGLVADLTLPPQPPNTSRHSSS
jgi:endonuclease/exonuclease/phosphatase family metal-dependent hydrolase